MSKFPSEIETYARDVRRALGRAFEARVIFHPKLKKFCFIITTELKRRPFEVTTLFPVGMSPDEYVLVVLKAFERAQKRIEGGRQEAEPVVDVAIEETIDLLGNTIGNA